MFHKAARRFHRRPVSTLVVAALGISFAVACGGTDELDAGVDAALADGAPSDLPAVPFDMPAIPRDATGADDLGSAAGTPLFVAQGHVGRTIVSCDDGRTWVGDTSIDDAVRCWQAGDPREVECDHHPGSSKGIVYGRDRFFGSLGWGMPGAVRRGDGAAWTSVLEGTTFGDVAYGNGVLLAAARTPQRSTNEGESFTIGTDSGMTVSNVRRAGFAAYGEGVFVMVGEDSGTVDIVLSPNGVDWTHPDTLPAECGHAIQTEGGIAYGNGVILMLGGDGVACTSSNGGRTFSASNVGVAVGSHLVFDGSAFLAFARGEQLRSTDGATWTRSATTPASLSVGAIAYSPETGTLVGVLGGWQVWYDRQVMYRSTDHGLTWEPLGGAAFPGGHPIRSMTFGRGVCPAP